jgi:hypothetical protein
LTQQQAGALLGEKMRELGDKPEKAGFGHTAWSRFEMGEPPPSWVLRGLKELTKLSYEALIEPTEFLRKHPELYAQGKRPLPEHRGYPRGVPRKRAQKSSGRRRNRVVA